MIYQKKRWKYTGAEKQFSDIFRKHKAASLKKEHNSAVRIGNEEHAAQSSFFKTTCFDYCII